jgi:glutamine amidotransferase
VISIVDYGVGNAQAFLTLFKALGIQAERANTPELLNGASRLILPGVGHFDHAMQQLNKSGLRPKLEDLVLGSNIPVMGVCVGMQMLAEESEEGTTPGLGWISGQVRAFENNPQASRLPMPHMGWNDLRPTPTSKIFSHGFNESLQFYFLHSYYFDANNKEDVAATAHYGIDFDAVVSRGHIHGVQCHPEKSHRWGRQLLKNFAEL